MRTDYKDFCIRLKEERQRLSLSQMEISALLRISQGHYCKVEKGDRILSYYEIQNLCETDVDVYYVFTGEREKPVEVESFLKESTAEELKRYLEFLCILDKSLFQTKQLTSSNDNSKKLENIRYALMPSEKGKTIFYKLRQGLDYNQTKMAELMKVDIKKLRGMEKGIILPDGELMCQMMDVFSISYALLLNDKNGLIGEINYLLNLIKEDKREDALETMRNLL